MNRTISRVSPQSNTSPYSRAFIAGVFLSTFLIVGYWIWDGFMRYTIAETLMNYSFGFYRRSLIGTLLLLVPNKTAIQTLITLLYSICLIIPLIIIRNQLRTIPEKWVLLILFFFLCSPLGIFFYLKDTRAIRKELFFYLFFYFLLVGWPSTNGWKNMAVALFTCLCALVHESFCFLFLPFLLCYLWLNNRLTAKALLVQLAFGLGITLVLLKAPGNSFYVTSSFIKQYVALGYPEESFSDFLYFQALTTQENLAVSLQHFFSPVPFITLGVLIGQFALLYALTVYFGVNINVQRPKALLISIGIISLGAFSLCLAGMDYGRWMAMAFGTSMLLTASQISRITRSTVNRPQYQYALVGIVVILLSMLIRVPYYTYYTEFTLDDWLETADTFRKLAAYAMRWRQYLYNSF